MKEHVIELNSELTPINKDLTSSWEKTLKKEVLDDLRIQRNNFKDDDSIINILDPVNSRINQYLFVFLYDKQYVGTKRKTGEDVLLFGVLIPKKFHFNTDMNSVATPLALYFEVNKTKNNHSMLNIADYGILRMDLNFQNIFNVNKTFQQKRDFIKMESYHGNEFRFLELHQDEIFQLVRPSADPSDTSLLTKVMGLNIPKDIALPLTWPYNYDFYFSTHALQLDNWLGLNIIQNVPIIYPPNKLFKNNDTKTKNQLNSKYNIEFEVNNKGILQRLNDIHYRDNNQQIYSITNFYIYMEKTQDKALGIVHMDIESLGEFVNNEIFNWTFYDKDKIEIFKLNQEYEVKCGTKKTIFNFAFTIEQYDKLNFIGLNQSGKRDYVKC